MNSKRKPYNICTKEFKLEALHMMDNQIIAASEVATNLFFTQITEKDQTPKLSLFSFYLFLQSVN